MLVTVAELIKAHRRSSPPLYGLNETIISKIGFGISFDCELKSDRNLLKVEPEWKMSMLAIFSVRNSNRVSELIKGRSQVVDYIKSYKR